MLKRPRRNRINPAVRGLVRENELLVKHLVWPVFIEAGQGICTPISALPGVNRVSVDVLLESLKEATDLGILAVALFPKIEDRLKNSSASESVNPEGLVPDAIRRIKEKFPHLCVITDVALDPFSSDGHDGIVRENQIINDETVEALAAMAVCHAAAGADVVACSDMMDGRVLGIRQALDEVEYINTLICSYSAKYASAFYDPFRVALDSAPRAGDKKTYQMDPANSREAIMEVLMDQDEGADWILIKPGMPYLDIVSLARQTTHLPVAVYQVSGEYAMIKAASLAGWLNYEKVLMESLLCFVRAGADMIFTYGALDAARLLKQS
ncbi:MAG: porphobilinogen synthase [Candidatus Cloacimonetes bacterium]|nr:porphobilinogen synthase [Candidatus Cloacimonadota bacterium]